MGAGTPEGIRPDHPAKNGKRDRDRDEGGEPGEPLTMVPTTYQAARRGQDQRAAMTARGGAAEDGRRSRAEAAEIA